MTLRKIWMAIAIFVLLVIGGGYAVHSVTGQTAASDGTPEPVLQTVAVTRGDIVLSVSGSGELIPAIEQALVFQAAGMLGEVTVDVGDPVQAGAIVARLETDSLERALANAEVKVRLAQADLVDVQAGPTDAELANARATVRNAQTQLTLALDNHERVANGSLDASVENRKAQYDWYVGYYQKRKAEFEDGRISQTEHDYAMNAMLTAEGAWQDAVNQAAIGLVEAQSQVQQARNAVYQAQEALALLESQPLTDTLERATLAVDQALLERERARTRLDAAQLTAPFDGIVMSIPVSVGGQVGENTTIVTLANLQEPQVRFWVEESDAGSVAPGVKVAIVFEALPDETFTGEVIRVDPELVQIDNTTALQAYASVELGGQDTQLLSGMTADIELTAGEALGVLLAPVEAVHQSPPDRYAVYVVSGDGEVEMREVSVGLSDVMNVEILAGLEEGELLSVGAVR